MSSCATAGSRPSRRPASRRPASPSSTVAGGRCCPGWSTSIPTWARRRILPGRSARCRARRQISPPSCTRASRAELGPRIYAAGPVFTAPGGHPAEVLRAWLPWYLRWYVVPRATREVATPADGRAAVAALLPERPDVLKLAIDAGATGDVPRLPVETIAAITAAGHAAGVRSIAHIGSSSEAVDAVRGGVDALAHAPWREELTDAAVAAIAAARILVVPTLAVWDLGGEPRTRSEDFLPIERAVARADVVSALLAPGRAPDAATAAFMR